MKPIRMIVTFALLATLTACNTIEGVGQDVQSGGRAVERAADSSK